MVKKSKTAKKSKSSSQNNISCFCDALNNGDYIKAKDLVLSVVKKGNLESYLENRGHQGRNILHLCVIYNDVQTLTSILNATSSNESLEVQDTEGLTVLSLAVVKCRYDVTKVLVERKVELDVADRTGNAPMHYAVGGEEVVDKEQELDAGMKSYEPYFPEDTPHVPICYTRCTEEEMMNRSKQFYLELNKRRSCRFMSTEPVPRAVMENILLAGGTSPSGAHTEPWMYCLVGRQDLKEQIRDIVEQEELVNYNSRMGDQWVNDLKFVGTDWKKEYLSEAPWLILVFKQTYGVNSEGGRRNYYYNEISTCISAGLLLAAIQMAGLVTLTSTPMNSGPALRKLLERPAQEKLMLLLPCGYPSDSATVPDISRKPLEEISAIYE